MAWEIATPAGLIVVRRNHPRGAAGPSGCQGWDVWIDGRFRGAVGSRSLAELAALPRRALEAAARDACCGRHVRHEAGMRRTTRDGWGGPRPNSGRRPKGGVKRVTLATTVAAATLERIDRLRGEASRGAFLDHVLDARDGSND